MTDLYQSQRAMRNMRKAALQRGVIAILDVGTSKIACLILRFDGLEETRETDGVGSMAGQSNFRVIGAATTRSRGVRFGEIAQMNETERAIRTAVQADDNHPGCGFQQRGVWHGIGVIDLHRLKFQLIAAAFDAQPDADIIGVHQLLVRAQKMHQRDLLSKPCLVGLAIAVAGRGIVQRLGRLDDGLAGLGTDRQRAVKIQHARHSGRRHPYGVCNLFDGNHGQSVRPTGAAAWECTVDGMQSGCRQSRNAPCLR